LFEEEWVSFEVNGYTGCFSLISNLGAIPSDRNFIWVPTLLGVVMLGLVAIGGATLYQTGLGGGPSTQDVEAHAPLGEGVWSQGQLI
jgi:hypothetical protein